MGERLKAAREAAGLSQRQLSFGGCSPAYISRIESGERIPSLQLLRELGRRLGVSEDYLATGAERADRRETLAAAELARQFDDAETARELYQGVLDTSADPGERADAIRGLGQLELGAGRPRPALALFEQALAATDQADRARPSVAEGLGRARAALGDLDSAAEIYERSLADAERRREPIEEMRFGALLAEVLADSGDLAGAEEAAAKALAYEEEALDPRARARLLWSQAEHREGGEAEAAASARGNRPLALLELAEDATLLGLAHRVAAAAALGRGESEAALRELDAGWSLVERGTSPFARAHVLIDKARALARLDRADEAEVLVRETTEKLEGSSPGDLGRASSLAADVYLELGNPERAQELCEQAAEHLEQNAPTRYLAEVYSKLAALHEAEGRRDRAFEYEARARHAAQAAPHIRA